MQWSSVSSFFNAECVQDLSSAKQSERLAFTPKRSLQVLLATAEASDRNQHTTSTSWRTVPASLCEEWAQRVLFCVQAPPHPCFVLGDGSVHQAKDEPATDINQLQSKPCLTQRTTSPLARPNFSRRPFSRVEQSRGCRCKSNSAPRFKRRYASNVLKAGRDNFSLMSRHTCNNAHTN